MRHKLIFLAQLTFNLMKRANLGKDNLLNEVHFKFLLREMYPFSVGDLHDSAVELENSGGGS